MKEGNVLQVSLFDPTETLIILKHTSFRADGGRCDWLLIGRLVPDLKSAQEVNVAVWSFNECVCVFVPDEININATLQDKKNTSALFVKIFELAFILTGQGGNLYGCILNKGTFVAACVFLTSNKCLCHLMFDY